MIIISIQKLAGITSTQRQSGFSDTLSNALSWRIFPSKQLCNFKSWTVSISVITVCDQQHILGDSDKTLLDRTKTSQVSPLPPPPFPLQPLRSHPPLPPPHVLILLLDLAVGVWLWWPLPFVCMWCPFSSPDTWQDSHNDRHELCWIYSCICRTQCSCDGTTPFQQNILFHGKITCATFLSIGSVINRKPCRNSY